jgi:hypothetical protein
LFVAREFSAVRAARYEIRIRRHGVGKTIGNVVVGLNYCMLDRVLEERRKVLRGLLILVGL